MNKYPTPDVIFGELFKDIQESKIFDDDKIIADLSPNFSPREILKAYRDQKIAPAFSLRSFVDRHFSYQAAGDSGFKSDTSRDVKDHIEGLWDVLMRKADIPLEGSSLIPLPHPYIVPGGRFNEIYYWDSYFTMLGLKVSNRTDIITNMVKNFAFLIKEIGFIPNGNRSYFLGRSQPPFFAMMVDLLAHIEGDHIYQEYLPALEKEYEFWMYGCNSLNEDQRRIRRVLLLSNGIKLNRYYDDVAGPRQEMFATDLHHQELSGRQADKFFLDVRTACESGWDFSCRWFGDKKDLFSIRASEIIPVDLNCLLSFLEETIKHAYALQDREDKVHHYTELSQVRRNMIRDKFWSAKDGLFVDLDVYSEQGTGILSLAGLFPLYFNIATEDQASIVAETVENHFLKPGGLVSTPYHTGQQWDAPNGWAPLQWMAIQGLKNYGHLALADEIANRWIDLNIKVYKNTGKMLEKYNVENIDLLSGGGEYPVQDGFGWTNGVLLKLLQVYPR